MKALPGGLGRIANFTLASSPFMRIVHSGRAVIQRVQTCRGGSEKSPPSLAPSQLVYILAPRARIFPSTCTGWRDGSEETLPPSQLVYILAPRSRFLFLHVQACRGGSEETLPPSQLWCTFWRRDRASSLFYMYRPAEMGARTPSPQLHQRSLADAGAPPTHFTYRQSRPFFTIVFFGASASYATRPPPGNSQPTPTGGSRLHMPCFLQASVGLVVLRERCDG